MKKKQKKMLSLSPEHKEALAKLVASDDFKALDKLLVIEKNNIAVLSWFRTHSNDPELALKKAKYEGRFEELKLLQKVFEDIRKGLEK